MHAEAPRSSSSTKRRGAFPVALVLILTVLGVGWATTVAGQPDSPDQAGEFLDLMESYLGLSNRFVATVTEKTSAVYLAIEGIIEIYEQRGEKAKAIPHLEKIIQDNVDNQGVRNVARFKLRDLYNETGRSDKAIEQLELIIQENGD